MRKNFIEITKDILAKIALCACNAYESATGYVAYDTGELKNYRKLCIAVNRRK